MKDARDDVAGTSLPAKLNDILETSIGVTGPEA